MGWALNTKELMTNCDAPFGTSSEKTSSLSHQQFLGVHNVTFYFVE